MKALLFFLLAAAVSASVPPATGKRLTGLEKRVTNVEHRVTVLEKGGTASPAPAPAAGRPAQPANPIAVYFVKKKQFVTSDRMGVTLYLEFENTTRRRYSAFSGLLIFKDGAGALIWSKPYGYSDPVGPEERIKVEIPVLSLQAKEYLKFLKAREITVSFEKQEYYGSD